MINFLCLEVHTLFASKEDDEYMRFDKFTIKSQELIQNAQSLASRLNNQQIEPEHLLAAMLDERDGIAVAMLRKLGASPVTPSETVEIDATLLTEHALRQTRCIERLEQCLPLRIAAVDTLVIAHVVSPFNGRLHHTSSPTLRQAWAA